MKLFLVTGIRHYLIKKLIIKSPKVEKKFFLIDFGSKVSNERQRESHKKGS